MKMYPPDGPEIVVRVRGTAAARYNRSIRYPIVRPEETDDYHVSFAFPGTPEQAYRQSVHSSAIANLPCGNCKLCLDCLRLERS